MGLATLLKGFKKEEFVVELEKKPTSIIWDKAVLDAIAENIKHIPIPDISIRSLDFSITRAKLSTIESFGLDASPRSVVKVNNNEYLYSGYREMVVDVLMLFLDIHGKPWLLEHKVSLNTRYMLNVYDDSLINVCICCVNTYIKEKKIWAMSYYKSEDDFKVDNINSMDLDDTILTKGYISVFGRHSDSTSISRIIKDFYRKDESGDFEDIGKNAHVEFTRSSNGTIDEFITRAITEEYNEYGKEVDV